jgi:hypothetical protein
MKRCKVLKTKENWTLNNVSLPKLFFKVVVLREPVANKIKYLSNLLSHLIINLKVNENKTHKSLN